MEHKKWIEVFDRYLTTGKMLSEEYELLDETQRLIINEFKKAYQRLNKREICVIHHSLTNNENSK